QALGRPRWLPGQSVAQLAPFVDPGEPDLAGRGAPQVGPLRLGAAETRPDEARLPILVAEREDDLAAVEFAAAAVPARRRRTRVGGGIAREVADRHPLQA